MSFFTPSTIVPYCLACYASFVQLVFEKWNLYTYLCRRRHQFKTYPNGEERTNRLGQTNKQLRERAKRHLR